jgi:hypothetical protein
MSGPRPRACNLTCGAGFPQALRRVPTAGYWCGVFPPRRTASENVSGFRSQTYLVRARRVFPTAASALCSTRCSWSTASATGRNTWNFARGQVGHNADVLVAPQEALLIHSKIGHHVGVVRRASPCRTARSIKPRASSHDRPSRRLTAAGSTSRSHAIANRSKRSMKRDGGSAHGTRTVRTQWCALRTRWTRAQSTISNWQVSRCRHRRST